jgi:6,7-dimethyl-8-ribityllumazine synthase
MMAKIAEPAVSGKGLKIGIVVSRFNDFVTVRLLRGCLEELSKCGVRQSDSTVIWVPGAWEIPLVAMKLAAKKNIDAVICLGAVIRGETAHFDVVARGTCDGIQQVALKTGKPAILGVLTTETVEQAYKRSAEKGKNNKGREAARVAIDMVHLLAKIKKI